MSRILFFLLLAVLVWVLFFKKKPADRGDGPARKGDPPAERIVQCAQCGLRLPEGEAIVNGTRHFCSAEHRDEHAQRG